jgi:2',3'-cyclic-nucleotide 2'-phosphodiesterase (5'-nucleotidase family)
MERKKSGIFHFSSRHRVFYFKFYTEFTRIEKYFQALGNHEFDNNIAGLLPFLQNANFTILSANANTATEPRITPYVNKSYVTVVGGEKIGVIGYTTKDTPMISQPGELNSTHIQYEMKNPR